MPEPTSPVAVHPLVIEIVVDCHDPKRLATFWSALLGVDIRGEVRAGTLWFVALLPICPDGPIIGFQQVPEGKVVKNRMHLDLRVTELDQAARRAVDLGGTPAGRVRRTRTAMASHGRPGRQ